MMKSAVPESIKTLAIELKHLFEEAAIDADMKNEETFLAPNLENALRRLLIDPCQASLIELLRISPVLIDSVCIFSASSSLVRQELLSSDGTSRIQRSGTSEARLLARLCELSPVPIEPRPGFRLLPSGVHSLLRMGIRRQLEKKFRPHFPAHFELLGTAIIKSVLVEEACESELAKYVAENICLIDQLAHNIHLDFPLAYAFSILLSFSFVQLGPKYPEKHSALLERSIELHLNLQNTYAMIPTHDYREWLDGIQLIAQTILIENSPKSPHQDRNSCSTPS